MLLRRPTGPIVLVEPSNWRYSELQRYKGKLLLVVYSTGKIHVHFSTTVSPISLSIYVAFSLYFTFQNGPTGRVYRAMCSLKVISVQ